MRGACSMIVVAASIAVLTGCTRRHPSTGAAVGPADVPAPAPAGATLANPKIAPVLTALARQVRAAASASAAAALSTPALHVNAAGRIQAYVHVTRIDVDVASALTRAGARIERSSTTLDVYQVWAAPDALARIAALPAVTRITPPLYGFPRRGAR